jgi:hypothetical protein
VNEAPKSELSFSLQTNGVYIEAGADDGEDASNSLYFELLGWKGLLVECTPPSVVELKTKNRKAWVADVCLSTTPKSGKVRYTHIYVCMTSTDYTDPKDFNGLGCVWQEANNCNWP